MGLSDYWWSYDRDSFSILVHDEGDGHVTHIGLTPEEAEALAKKIAEGLAKRRKR